MRLESGTFYRLLRGWVRLGAFFYFREMRAGGLHHVPPSGPVLLTANHQNSFLDAVVIAMLLPRPLHFMVRADVFRKPLARRLLFALNMMPVFRIRDGWQSLGKNAESFSRCAEIFRRGGMVLIFPEGNHSLLRRLRPLSRGFTKVIAQAMEAQPDLKLSVVPVGLNFTAHQQARSSVQMVIGRQLPITNYLDNGKIEANRLREDVAEQMKKLITHIDDEEHYDEVIRQLTDGATDFMNPQEANDRIRLLREGKLLPEVAAKTPSLIWRAGDQLARLLHFPVILVWRLLRKRITDPVFVGSIRFVVAVFGVPLYYLAILLCLIPFLGWWAALAPAVLAGSSLMLYPFKSIHQVNNPSAKL